MTDVLGNKAVDYYSKENAKLYELSGAFKRIQESMTADALSISDFEPNSLILDLGCGTGFSLNVLKKRGFNAIGADESFDNLVSISAIQWAGLNDYAKVLDEIKRVIKKEAILQFYPKEKEEFDYFLKLSKKRFRISQVFAIGEGVKEKKYIKLKK
jgi:ubiquinone/menaquinone biosynthesis C-methylase UbiE